MQYQIKLKIADMVFQISGPNQRPIVWLKKNYKAFLSNQNPDFNILLNLDKQRKIINSSFVPLAKWSNECSYLKTGFFDANINFTNRKVEVLADYDLGIVDLMRCLCSVILTKRCGFLLHASSVLDKGFSYVFFGSSESGKTTIARLSQDKLVLTDETTAIVKKNGSYYAYATPFAGEFGQVQKNAGSPIKAIFFIKKDIQFKHRSLKTIDAVKEMVCNTILSSADLKTINGLFNALESILKRIPCYELSFKPEPTIWRYIHEFVK